VAKGQLSTGALALLAVALGVVAEVAAPGRSGLLTATDFATGWVCAVAAVRLTRRSLRLALAVVALVLLWFAGTAVGGWSNGPAAFVTLVSLAYRVPLIAIAWQLWDSTSRFVWLGVTLIGCGAVALPLAVAGVVTGALLALGAARSVLVARRSRIDARSQLVIRSLLDVALAAVWCSAALGAAGAALEVGNDLLVSLVVIGIVWPIDVTRSQGVSGAVVIELGRAADDVTPLVARLRRMLADDDLQIRFHSAALEWVDDAGRPAEPPDLTSPRATRVSTASGSSVVLLHGAQASIRPDLSAAAAAACGLARDRVEIDAEARHQAGLVAASRRRLLDAADEERRALEAELQQGPLTTLAQVDKMLQTIANPMSADLRAVLSDAVDDLVRLAHGLYPAAVSHADFGPALRGLAANAPFDVVVEVTGDVAKLSTADRALAWFVCSECLTNAVRHAAAKHLFIRCAISDAMTITVTDDGVGGASIGAGHGLRSLADRLDTAGGRLTVDSPAGGPTIVVATVRLP
jgi:signal transduction histidine kinase